VSIFDELAKAVQEFKAIEPDPEQKSPGDNQIVSDYLHKLEQDVETLRWLQRNQGRP
jgi:hypothetical protein